jgi:hypothetical protein
MDTIDLRYRIRRKIVAQSISTGTSGVAPLTSNQKPGNVQLDLQPVGAGDADQFRAALERHSAAVGAASGEAAGSDKSLGTVIAQRVSGLASEFQKDQQYVSKLLEKATRTGDSLQLMRAMLALNDYQIRVQAISKTVSKAATAIDQLTKLQ